MAHRSRNGSEASPIRHFVRRKHQTACHKQHYPRGNLLNCIHNLPRRCPTLVERSDLMSPTKVNSGLFRISDILSVASASGHEWQRQGSRAVTSTYFRTIAKGRARQSGRRLHEGREAVFSYASRERRFGGTLSTFAVVAPMSVFELALQRSMQNPRITP